MKNLNRYVCFVLILLCMIGFLQYHINDLTRVVAVANTQINNNQKSIETLQQNLEREIQKVNTLQTENATLKKSIRISNNKQNQLIGKQKNIEDAMKEVEENTNKVLEPYRKVAYLTFDDGPSENTYKILKTLKDYNIKATFFVCGNTYYKDAFLDMKQQGHLIANHTFSHNYSQIYKSKEDFYNDVIKLEDGVNELIDYKMPKILRFPGGSNNLVCKHYSDPYIMPELTSFMKNKGYDYFDWNITSGDADVKTQQKEIIINNVLNQAKHVKKAVILMHDSVYKTTTAEALPEIIEGLKKQGFVFETINKNTPTCKFLNN